MLGAKRLLFALLILLLVFFGVSQPTSNGNANTTIFSFPYFGQNNSNQLVYMGNASFSPSQAYIALTPDSNQTDDLPSSVGRVIYRQPVQIWPASFTSTFTIVAKNISLKAVGDGMAFIIVPNNKTFLPGSDGGDLGMYNYSTRGNTTQQLAIEFDTFQNEFDPDNNHVGIDTKSIHSDETASFGIHGMEINSGRPIRVRVHYDGWAKSLQIYAAYADNATATYAGLLNTTIELSRTVPRLAYVGFSAATWQTYAIQRVLDWNFSLVTLPESSIALPPAGAPTPVASVAGGSRSRLGVKVGVPVAVAVVVAVLSLWLFARRKRRNALTAQARPALSQGLSDKLAVYDNVPHNFTYTQLSAATKNFSEEELLGAGGFGKVYRAQLENEGAYAAVKRISARSRQGAREFISEIATIGRLRHRNLVQLQGWCHERDELLLVYDYMPNGSLDRILFGAGEHLNNWQLRRRIVCGLASALLYLHEEWEQRVVHRDVKPSNVMLDGDFNARLGDFGLARFIEHDDSSLAVTTRVAGTPGYMAPECSYTGKATAESDVFSFGIVLLEVATGRRVMDRKLEESLVEWVWSLYGKGRVGECADPRLEFDGDVEERKEIERVLVLGLACSHPDPNLRPSMRQVLQVLKNSNEEMPTLPSTRPMAIYLVLPSGRTVHSALPNTAASTETSIASVSTSRIHSGR